MTPRRHGQANQATSGNQADGEDSRQKEAVTDLLDELAQRDPGLCKYLRDRLDSGAPAATADPSGGADEDEPVMIGESDAMRRAFKAIRRFATTDAPTLITGESGTGKELAALAIHERSAFASGPFMPVNCAGLPPTLISTELFGHEKGAFTGATQRKIGRIEASEGGTIFLDEIGDMPMELQAHLLRFLQESTIERVGGHRQIPVNVRVLAATNKDLAQEVEAGRFRQDLYFRLNVLSLELPALRDRGEDIMLISNVFVRRFAGELGSDAVRFSDCARLALARHDWPGNVREMISRIRRAVVMADAGVITADDLGLAAVSEYSSTDTGAAQAGPSIAVPIADDGGVLTLDEAKSRLEEVFVRAALERNSFNVTAAASDLGVSRVTMYRHIDRFGLKTGRSYATH